MHRLQNNWENGREKKEVKEAITKEKTKKERHEKGNELERCEKSKIKKKEMTKRRHEKKNEMERCEKSKNKGNMTTTGETRQQENNEKKETGIIR